MRSAVGRPRIDAKAAFASKSLPLASVAKIPSGRVSMSQR
jgi:hypothetical protein